MNKNFTQKLYLFSISLFLALLPQIVFSKLETVFLAEYIVHGAGGPVVNILKEDFVNSYGYGQLYPNGQRQLFQLGQKLREIYPSIFQNQAQHMKFVKIYTSNNQNSLYSSQVHLLGLFPEGTGKYVTSNNKDVLNPPFEGLNVDPPIGNWAIKDGFLPLSFKVENKSQDVNFLESMQESCHLGFTNQTSTQIQLSNKFQKENFDYFSKLSQDIKTAGLIPKEIVKTDEFLFSDYTSLFDSVRSHFYFSGFFPKQIDKALYKKMKILSSLQDAMFLEGDYCTLHSTKIIQLVINSMRSIVHNLDPATPKFMAFFGSGLTLQSFLIKAGYSSIDCLSKGIYGSLIDNCQTTPEPAANIIFELSKEASGSGFKFYVRTLYNGKPLFICENQSQSGYCNFEVFEVTATNTWTILDFEFSCSGYVREYKFVSYITIVSLMIAAIIFLCYYVSQNHSKPIELEGVHRMIDVFSDLKTSRLKTSFHEYEREKYPEDDIDEIQEDDNEDDLQFDMAMEELKIKDDDEITYFKQGDDDSMKFQSVNNKIDKKHRSDFASMGFRRRKGTD